MKVGDKVKCISDYENAWGSCTPIKGSGINVGDVLTISLVDVRSWHTKLCFGDDPRTFNSVHFEEMNERKMRRPEIIIGVTFLPYDPDPNDLLPRSYYAAASGRIIHEDDIEDYRVNHPECRSILAFEYRTADEIGSHWFYECDGSLEEALSGCEHEISCMVRGAIDAFNQGLHWVDYWLAFEMNTGRCWTELGWEYDGGCDFVGFITGLEVSERP